MVTQGFVYSCRCGVYMKQRRELLSEKRTSFQAAHAIRRFENRKKMMISKQMKIVRILLSITIIMVLHISPISQSVITDVASSF